MIYSFGGLTVDTDQIELRDGDTLVHVEPQVYDLLRHLIENRHRVVTKQELFEEIWGGAFVGESTLTSRIRTARQAVGDSGRAQRVIRTVHGRGYQFVAEVTARSQPSPGHVAGEAPTGAPTGTVTFLFSDIERSSLLWEKHPALMAQVIPRHDELLREAVGSNGGIVFATGGDGMAVAFGRVVDAVEAAEQIRSSLDDEQWPAPIVLRVRLGLHTGEALERDGDYLGPAVNRAARVMSAANGGQTLLSDVTAEILAEPDALTDLGMCQIDPAMPPMRLWQLGSARYPPLTGTVASAPPTLRKLLIGRESDLESVVSLASTSRLVSITGPGGAGKTSLALAAANAELASYPAGVAFAELAAANDSAGVSQAIAEAIGIQGPSSTDYGTLARHLAQRPMLLVLDNCEHLLDECAAFVDGLLDTGSAIHVLTTTREPLGVEGEAVFPLASLDSHAPELFVTRARSVASEIDLSADDPRVIEVCHHLDGLPLAVELAAAQLQFLGLDELRERLDGILDLSNTGRLRGGQRHVTLDRTIAWSYDLLGDSGRRLLRQLGVFPATFDLRAAEAVGSGGHPPVLTEISDLVAKNLLVRHADTGRYRLLETIRTFALRRLEEAGEADAARERLRRHVVARATRTSRVDRWFSGTNAASFRADLDNARVAFERSISHGHVRDALEILVDGAFLWRNTLNCTDGRRWIDELGNAPEALGPPDELWLALMRADIGQGTADHEAMQRAAEDAVELARIAGDAEALVIALHFEALPYIVAAPEDAASRLRHALGIADDLDDPRLAQLLEVFAAVAALADGDVGGGVERAEEVAHATEGDGYQVFIANWAAWMATLISEDAEALRHWTDRQRDYLALVGLRETWLTIWSMALSSAMEGEDVHIRLRQARLRADREGLQSATDTVLALAMIARFEQRPRDAAGLLGVVTGHALNNTAHYVLYRTLRGALRAQLGPGEVEDLMRRGSTMSMDSVLEDHDLSLTS